MAESLIFSDSALAFASLGNGLFAWQSDSNIIPLTVGESYTVEWDGTRHSCVAVSTVFNDSDAVAIGNFGIVGAGENNEMPFLLGTAVAGDLSLCYTTEADATNAVAIYHVTEEEEPDKEYLIWGSTLKGIANAIRYKSGASGEIAVKDMASKIAAITGGGGDGNEDNVVLGPVIASGECGDSVTWQLDEYGLMLISGDGAMADYGSAAEQPWYDYAGTITSVVIQKGVTSIGSYAFRECANIARLSIPDSVTSIGHSAFRYCANIASLSIPDSVTSTGTFSFMNCTSIASITIGNGMLTIGNYSFSNCTSLTSIIIPDSVTDLGVSAFEGCTALESVSLSANLTWVKSMLFSGCENLKQIVLPDGVTKIGTSAFKGCSKLVWVIIPSGVVEIGSYAFSGCSALISAVLYLTSGWWYSSSYNATSGTAIPSSGLPNASTAASYLRSTYASYFWFHS